ncbi:MAG: hypothetical protein PUH12_05215 [Lachnospiraceae bacterium]|nr:hypothetical protein [Lachnospiraceae bacterium]
MGEIDTTDNAAPKGDMAELLDTMATTLADKDKIFNEYTNYQLDQNVYVQEFKDGKKLPETIETKFHFLYSGKLNPVVFNLYGNYHYVTKSAADTEKEQETATKFNEYLTKQDRSVDKEATAVTYYIYDDKGQVPDKWTLNKDSEVKKKDFRLYYLTEDIKSFIRDNHNKATLEKDKDGYTLEFKDVEYDMSIINYLPGDPNEDTLVFKLGAEEAKYDKLRIKLTKDGIVTSVFFRLVGTKDNVYVVEGDYKASRFKDDLSAEFEPSKYHEVGSER